MKLKPTCKSQYLTVHDETQKLLEQGYTKKAVFDYFLSQKKITMSYKAWLKIIKNYDKKSPFSKKITSRKIGQNLSSKKGTFHHSNDPYPTDSTTPKKEKEKELPFNLIKKKK